MSERAAEQRGSDALVRQVALLRWYLLGGPAHNRYTSPPALQQTSRGVVEPAAPATLLTFCLALNLKQSNGSPFDHPLESDKNARIGLLQN